MTTWQETEARVREHLRGVLDRASSVGGEYYAQQLADEAADQITRWWADVQEDEVTRLSAECAKGERWRRIVSDLDRCPHGRHEGDGCAGWRGPGRYDGGCQGGVSLGNPLHGVDAVLGIDYSGQRLIVMPAGREDRVDPAAWYHPRSEGEELHHYIPVDRNGDAVLP